MPRKREVSDQELLKVKADCAKSSSNSSTTSSAQSSPSVPHHGSSNRRRLPSPTMRAQPPPAAAPAARKQNLEGSRMISLLDAESSSSSSDDEGNVDHRPQQDGENDRRSENRRRTLQSQQPAMRKTAAKKPRAFSFSTATATTTTSRISRTITKTKNRLPGRLSTEAISRERTSILYSPERNAAATHSSQRQSRATSAPSEAVTKQLAKLPQNKAGYRDDNANSTDNQDSDARSISLLTQDDDEGDNVAKKSKAKFNSTNASGCAQTTTSSTTGTESTSTALSSLSSSTTTASNPASKTMLSRMGNVFSGWRGKAQKESAAKQATSSTIGEDHGIPETLSERAQQCWVCRVDFEVEEGKLALYTRHAHPLFASMGTLEDGSDEGQPLTVPVCSECAPRIVNRDEKLTSSDDEDSSNNDNGSSLDFCSMCQDADSEILFCCDECPRSICLECVALCHGGGKEGLGKAREIEASSDDFACPLCQPTPALQELGPVVRSNSRTEEETIELLGVVEDCQKEADGQLEQEEQMRIDIRCELEASGKDSSAEAVEEEFKTWKHDLVSHYNRLLDTISHLQEELDQVHGLRLAEVYADILKREKPKTQEDAAWVLAANKEIQLREAEEKKKVPSPRRMAEESYENIEDLQTEDLSIDALRPKAQGYAGTFGKAHPDDIQHAVDEEQRILQEKKLTVIVVNEMDDQRDQEQRQLRSSRACANEYANVIRPRKKKPQSASLSKPLANQRVAVSASHSDAGQKDMPNDESSDHVERHAPKAAPSSPVPSKVNIAECRTPSRATASSNTAVARTMASAPMTASRQMVAEAKKQAALEHVPRNRGQHRSVVGLEDYVGSSLTLPGSDVCIATELASKLKGQQIEAVQFMWKNAFADFMLDASECGGCILAHNMGLGKTCSAIALIHAVLSHGLVKRILVLVPVNTVENWKAEFSKWIGQIRPHLDPLSLSDMSGKKSKQQMVQRWEDRGGALLAAPSQLKALPDIVTKCEMLVCDEAHMVVKNTDTKTYSYLAQLQTKRRIALTGTPLQNNLMEYFNMFEFFIGREVMGSKSEFEREFEQPICRGLTTDCSPEDEILSAQKTAALHEKLAPYVHRKDASELARDLPPMQSVVLYLRPSKMQTTFFRSHKRHQAKRHSRNFFEAFAALKPINNHPGCLLHKNCAQNRKSSGAEDDVVPDSSSLKWWQGILDKYPIETLAKAENGFKIVLLLHILVKAQQLGEKVIIFSQCLPTLNFVEQVLQSKSWGEHSQSLAELLGQKTYGGWRKGIEFLRIDGSTSGADRGTHIEEFGRNDQTRAFLLSSVAGGVGINLYAASRVVLLDTHFNPAISEQAIFRAYRYGQTKPVFVYRLLTEASMEEKVYARAQTKAGLALRIVDKKNIHKYFSSNDLADLTSALTWVQCDSCEKWRVLYQDENADDLPDRWFCSMNLDPKNNKCTDPERDQKWYEHEASLGVEGGVLATERTPVDQQQQQQPTSGGDSMSESKKKKLETKDPILQHLLMLTPGDKNSTMVSKHAFHELVAQKEEAVVLPATPASSQKQRKKSPTKAPSSVGRSPASTVGSRRSKRDRHKINRFVDESSSEFKKNTARSRNSRSIFGSRGDEQPPMNATGDNPKKRKGLNAFFARSKKRNASSEALNPTACGDAKKPKIEEPEIIILD